ncbi:dna helicase ii atp-dependent dna helicase [Trichoderma cornu-damae]|uniref:DNA 3'-5' helicase n=1 Tax=Trichoderma cornu-damae TaxID=654480 RepID=A0A9P8QGI2_9HYPO|nr:dna helicase ii atp-dependent dna helicase [Trichoderma cornu-damae]
MSTAQAENPILRSLNAAQRRAVTSNASTVAILAGPGSGKTHTLTSRVVWLVQQTGYQPSDIVVATFTVKAAREMKERIGKALGPECEKKIVLGTFHSIARRYLGAYGKTIGLDSKFGIADDGDSRAIVQRICKRHDWTIDPGFARSWISKKKARGHAMHAASAKKQPENPSLIECHREYQEHLERSNLLDYDDLLVRCVELLKAYPACVSNIQAVLIDEYQDTNGIQYDLMKLFAQARQRITIVGDPDQSIYGWRSAEIRNLYRLLRDYPETDEISLEENYRSSRSILDVSLTVIQQDKKRYQKVLLPVHTKGARPVLRKLKSSAAEGDWIVSEIKRAVTMFGDMLTYEDVAILLRSASLSRQIESALGKAGLAYRMIGGHKFYERKEIKILLDYLRAVYQPDNNDCIARIINVPRRGIGETTVKRLVEEAEQQGMSLWSLLRRHCHGGRKAATKILPKMEQKINGELMRLILNLQNQAEKITEGSQQTLVSLVEKLLSQLDFKQYLASEYPEDHEQRWQNVQEFLSLANDFVRDSANADDELLPEIDNVDQAKADSILGRFLANVALASDAQRDGEGAERRSVITLSTIHAAKGLEWPVVFVPAVYAGSIPHSRAEDLDEERRLLYVAMTRAQVLLYLSCPLYGSQGMSNKVELSPFVSAIASTAFAKQGATFDRPVLEGAAKILGRELPSEKAIFDKIPPMFSPEDNLFPVDPIDTRDAEGLDNPEGHRPKGPKRQRLSNHGYDDDEGTTEERPWQKEYSTTMEQASSFTMASLPGFISAGTHRNALSAAATAAAAEAEKAAAARKKAIKVGTTRRKADQTSLLGFVTTTSKKSAAPIGGFRGPDMSMARYQLAASRSAARLAAEAKAPELPKLPDVDPSFAKHKLASGNALHRPHGMGKQDGERGSKKRYNCFSSSPPKPVEAEESKEEQAAAEPSPVPDRPASSFHRTTFVSASAKAGVRRPVGLGPPPGMDRLRKPFKPLTITRPVKPQSGRQGGC